jgi:AraC-like DNA-binding protein
MRAVPNVLALLPDALYLTASRGVPSLIRVGSLAEARAHLRTSTVRGLICDPTQGPACTADDLFWLATDFPVLHVSVYTKLEAAAAQTLLRLAAVGVSDVVFFGHEDAPERWGDLMAQASVRDTVARALAAVEPALRPLEASLRSALRDAFRFPRKFATVDQFAGSVAAARRAVYRRLQRVGVRGVREWLDWARLVNAFALLRDPEREARDVAVRVGYVDAADLATRVRAATGWSVDALRVQISVDALIACMRERLLVAAAGEVRSWVGSLPEEMADPGGIGLEDRRRA